MIIWLTTLVVLCAGLAGTVAWREARLYATQRDAIYLLLLANNKALLPVEDIAGPLSIGRARARMILEELAQGRHIVRTTVFTDVSLRGNLYKGVRYGSRKKD